MTGNDQLDAQFARDRRRFLVSAVGCGVMFPAIASTTASANETDSASRVVRFRSELSPGREAVVKAITADPSGELLAVAGDDHVIRIIDIQSLQVRKRLRGHTDRIQTLDFDSDGDRLISAGNDGLIVQWHRRRNFELAQRIQGPIAWSCVRFAPDDQEIAAVGFESEVFLIGSKQKTGRPKAECDCTDLRAVDYRDDGTLLAVAGRNGHLHLFERPSNVLLGEYALHQGRIHSIKFVTGSPVVVSAGEDGNVVLFDTDVRETIGRINVARGKLFSVCIIDEEHLATAGSDNAVYVINTNDSQRNRVLVGHTGSIAALASVDGFLFSGGFDASLRCWQLDNRGGRTAKNTSDASLDR